jgi:hypothetical protein
MIHMIGDKELHSLLDLPAEERLKLARILIESAAEDARGDSSNQNGGEKIVSTNSWLSLAGRYAGGPSDTSEQAETILETEVDKLSGLSVR